MVKIDNGPLVDTDDLRLDRGKMPKPRNDRDDERRIIHEARRQKHTEKGDPIDAKELKSPFETNKRVRVHGVEIDEKSIKDFIIKNEKNSRHEERPINPAQKVINEFMRRVDGENDRARTDLEYPKNKELPPAIEASILWSAANEAAREAALKGKTVDARIIMEAARERARKRNLPFQSSDE